MTFSDDLEAVRERAGMPRFSIRRHRLDYPTARPWVVADRNRPHWLGSAPTHAAAIDLVAAQVERELPPERHVNAPCTVEPILTDTRGACTCWRLIRDESAPYGTRHARGCPRA